MLKSPSIGLVAGILLGVAVITAVNVSGHDLAPEREPVKVNRVSERAALAFFDDWKKMQAGTWSVAFRYTRTTTDGREYNSDSLQAQAPPKSMSYSGNVLALLNDDVATVCGGLLAPGQTQQCSQTEIDSYKKRTDEGLDTVKHLVTGMTKLYDVGTIEGQPGCYDLYKRPRLPIEESGRSVAWGDSATMCFDASTHALIRSTYKKDGAVDSLTATSVRTVVDPTQFEIPPNALVVRQ